MKRRIISQGNNSYTLTLPIAWIRRNSLAQGGEVTVEEEENQLRLSTEKKPEKKSLTLTLPENHPRGIRFLLQQAYRQNYSQIILRYSSEAIYQTVREIADQYFVGLEIVEKQKNSCTLAALVEVSEERFQVFMRKMFLLLRESLGLLAINPPTSNDLQTIHYHYLKLYAYQNYGKRYLYSQKAELSSYDYYALLSYLLNIHSDLEKLAQASKGLKRTSSLTAGLGQLSAFLGEIEKNFYLKKPEVLMKIGEEIQKMIASLQAKIPAKNELAAWHYQLEIARLLYGALSPLLGIVLYETQKEGALSSSVA